MGGLVDALRFFDAEILKRRGRGIPPTRHQYLRRDGHIMPNVSHRALLPRKKGVAGGKRTSQMSHDARFPRNRIVEIPTTMAGALRHRELDGETEEDRTPVRSAA